MLQNLRQNTSAFGRRPALEQAFFSGQGSPLVASTRCQRQQQRHSRLVTRAGMFDTLSQSLDKAWDIVRKDGKLTADNIKGPMREIRRALLEADVSLPTVRQFVKGVEEKCLGMRVVKGVSPDQQLVKVVHDQLVELMGGQQAELVTPDDGPQIILMAGLQGVGKTTACGKLALALQKQNKKVLLVATDVYRPAAIEQLKLLGERVNVPVFELGQQAKPADIAKQGLAKANKEKFDAVIIDTAGRLQIDDTMMGELREVKAAVKPTDTLLVVDAMTGQEAAGLVKSFHEAADLSGAILTKMDGDSRGGAALSVFAVSGRPIKYVGTGETMDALEPFYPDRISQRVLGMGDVVSLVERMQEGVQEEEATRMAKRMMENKFDYNDFLNQMRMMSRLGGLTSMIKMLPGMARVSEKQLWGAEKQFKKWEAMIGAMTDEEREDPDLLASSNTRRERVARESGEEETTVSEMVATFAAMRDNMRGMMGRMPGMGGMSNEQMLSATVAGAGPQRPANGKARRRKATATVSKGF
ncbi:hypothetical protein WJX73_010683 [Symbiochloris irregularis]|uniref:signal-recognition-particle GTPase n=1 Tax=Symbiochloris irregularis TaxID=706552 RepID=A0AAW1PG83_9CHLO